MKKSGLWVFIAKKYLPKNEFSDIWILIGILCQLLRHVLASNPLVDVNDGSRIRSTFGIIIFSIISFEVFFRKSGEHRWENNPSQTWHDWEPIGIGRIWVEEEIHSWKVIIIRTYLQCLTLNWITVNWISWLIESVWPSPNRIGINICKNHRLIESKSRLIASLYEKITKSAIKIVNLTSNFNKI